MMVSVRAERLLGRINDRWQKMGDMKLGDGRAWIDAAQELLEAGLIERDRPEGARDYRYRRVGDAEPSPEYALEPVFQPPERRKGESRTQYAERVQKALEAFKSEPDPMEALASVVRNVIHAYSAADGDDAGIAAAVEILARWQAGSGAH